MIGQQLSHYRILAQIGAGGMGVVYRARDEQLGRDVALKLLPAHVSADATARERLLREARTASALNHPHICTIHEVGEANGQTYIAMEHVEGMPLSKLIGAEGLPTENVLRYGAQIAEALAHAHGKGIVHRDLKSANVAITADGRAKVLDFGLAKRLRSEELEEVTRSRVSLSQGGGVLGTLHYLAPEVLQGEAADARSDLWALGVMLYEMVTGRLPFRGQTGFDVSTAILRDAPAPLPAHLPAGLRGVILRCLTKDPAQRYQQASEVRAALEAVRSDTAGISGTTPEVSRTLIGAPRWLWLTGTAGVAVVVLAVLFGLNTGGLRDKLGGGANPGRIQSLAVLPLDNFSGDAGQEYFVDGMTEALTAELARIRALTVISRTSVMQYKGVKKFLPEIAKALKVDAVIEGSVVREGDQVRVTVQLIHGATDKHLWTETYQREMRSILALQSEVASAIANEIRIQVTPEERARLASARPVNPEAYEAYLLGRHYWNKFSLEGMNKSIEYYKQAIAKDPNHALAYAGLADTYTFLGAISELSAPREAMAKAKAAATQALKIDEGLAEAHVALALVRLNYDWDLPGAEKEFRRALEINASHPDAQHWYSHYFLVTGQIEESLQASQRAMELDPRNLAISIHLGCHYLYARQSREAVEASQKTVNTDPNFSWGRYFLGLAYEQAGQIPEAIAELRKASELEGSPRNLAALGHAYAMADQRAEALKVLEELRELAKRRYVSPHEIALVYAGLGDKEQALRWLEKAYADRSGALIQLNIESRFDALRTDARFAALIKRIGLPH